MRVRFLLLVLLILFSTNTFAEEKNSAEPVKKGKETKLEEIVVTATRTEKELDSAPGSVNVVTKKDVEKRNIQTIDEALNTTAGVVDSRGKGMMDKMANVTLRGISGQQRTLVLTDGFAVNSPYSGSVNWNGIVPEDVEKIEVVKGPFSSLYGGNAMGGVVNIITKMPEKREFTVKGVYGSSWHRGEALDDLKKFYVSYGDKIEEKLRLFLSYANNTTNGYPADLNVQSSKPTTSITGWTATTSNTGAKRYLIGDKGDNEWRNDSIAFKAAYDFSPTSRVKFSFLRATDDWHYDGPHTYLQNASGNEVWSYGTVKESSFIAGAGGSEWNMYNMGLETEISQAKVKLSLGYLDQATYWNVTADSSATRTGGTGTVSDTPTTAYNADLQVTVPFLDGHILTFGGVFKSAKLDSQNNSLTNWGDEDTTMALTYQSKGKDRTYAVFFQDEILLHEKLTAYVGFRQDWWETYDGYVNQIGTAGYPKIYSTRSDSSFSPKGALVYKPFEQTTLRTSAGRSFRSPTLYELYRTSTFASGTTYASNPDLKPETVTSWDISVEQGLWKGAKIKATYFENYISDMVYSKTTSSTLVDKVNAGKGESRGIELEAEQRFDKWLRLFANFTYTDSEIKENNANPASVGKNMVNTPRIMFNAGGDLEKGPFGASITGRYMSKRYSNDDNSDTASNVYGSYDDFFTVDTKISYKPVSWAEASFSVSNLLDREYYSYSPAPGRSWFLSLTLKY
ncbi:MAG: TonB-dependent receptor [Smithella sp.]